MRSIAFPALLLAAATASAGDPPAAAPAKAPAQTRSAAQMANLRKLVLEGWADAAQPRVRANSGDMLLAAWPDSAPILDEALVQGNDGVRLEAVQFLERLAPGDATERVRRKFDDTCDRVRRAAVRVARHRDAPELESGFIEVMQRDPSWLVRMEALRALEDRGTAKCLRAVFERREAEKSLDRKERHTKVLIRVLGKDCGADAEAWRAAIAEAERSSRPAASK